MENAESRGVAYLRFVIDSSKILASYFSQNDKTPSWDGFIFVYKNESGKKGEIFGRIPVQIKSKVIKKFHENNVSYAFEVEDLQNYYNDGGIILFVIEIYDLTARVFYTSLWISDLKEILNKTKEKKLRTTNIQLTELDTANISIFEADCRSFLLNRERQISTKDYPISHEKATEFTFLIPVDLAKNPEYLFTRDIGLYGKQFPTDVDHFISKQRIEEIGSIFQVPVSINGKIYYSKYDIQQTKDEKNYKFGKEVIIGPKGIRIKLLGTINDQLLDVDFLLDVINTKSINIGNQVIIILNFTGDEGLTKFLHSQKKRLGDIRVLFDLFSVPVDEIQLDLLDNQSTANLYSLIDLFIYNKGKGSLTCTKGLNKIRIGNIHLGILVFQGENDTKLHIANLNKPFSSYRFRIVTEEGKKIPFNPFVFLDKDFLILVDNLDLPMIIEDIKSIDYSDEYIGHVNLFGLELIKAYDHTNKGKFLTAATRIFSWLCEMNPDSMIYQANRLQIIRRQRAFTDEEKNFMRQMREQVSDNNPMKCCLSILLENKDDAEYFFYQLTQVDHDEFIEYPIFTLAKQLGMFIEKSPDGDDPQPIAD